MGEVLAMDIMTMMPTMGAQQMADDPRATAQGLFALACAAEQFEELAGERFEGIANALSVTARKLYETLQRNTLAGTSRWIMEPEEVGKAYQRFENVYMCIEELSDDLKDRWQTVIAWRNVQDRFRPLKAVLVHNSRYKPY